jgi:hypothetical protein
MNLLERGTIMVFVCAGLSEDLTCEQQLELLCQIMQANGEDRSKIQKSIGKKAGQLLMRKNQSSDQIRKELAEFVRNQILKKSRQRRGR